MCGCDEPEDKYTNKNKVRRYQGPAYTTYVAQRPLSIVPYGPTIAVPPAPIAQMQPAYFPPQQTYVNTANPTALQYGPGQVLYDNGLYSAPPQVTGIQVWQADGAQMQHIATGSESPIIEPADI